MVAVFDKKIEIIIKLFSGKKLISKGMWVQLFRL